MEFVRAKSGLHYRVDQVQRYWETKDNVQLHMSDDALVDVEPYNWRYAIESSAPVIPAAPGHFLVQPWHDDDGTMGAYEFSIVGWRWFDGDLIPLTTDTVNTMPDPSGSYTVRFPDGHIEAWGEPPFATLEAYLEYFARRVAREAALEARNKAKVTKAPAAAEVQTGGF